MLHSFVEGGDDAYGSEKRGTEIAETGADARGRAIRPPCQAHHAAHGLHNHVVAGQITEWPCMAKSRNRPVDNMWVRFGQPLSAIAETVHNARTKVLNNHIGSIKEPFEQFSIARRFDIESDALLTAVEAHEIG